jgi:hypothetical protein
MSHKLQLICSTKNKESFLCVGLQCSLLSCWYFSNNARNKYFFLLVLLSSNVKKLLLYSSNEFCHSFASALMIIICALTQCRRGHLFSRSVSGCSLFLSGKDYLSLMMLNYYPSLSSLMQHSSSLTLSIPTPQCTAGLLH